MSPSVSTIFLISSEPGNSQDQSHRGAKQTNL